MGNIVSGMQKFNTISKVDLWYLHVSWQHFVAITYHVL